MSIHLMYVEMHHGGEPAEVAYVAGIAPVGVPDATPATNIRTCLKHTVSTENIPRVMLKKLEDAAFEATGIRPDYHDGMDGPKDFESLYADLPRWIGYRAEGARKDAERNPKLLKAYQALVDSVSAVPDADS